MKKRILMTLLCASMIATLVTACGSSSKGSNSKTETSKKETVSVEKEDTKDYTDKEEPKEEDIEKEETQSEIVEKKYNRENFWDEFKILADGNEIVLGETTLQDLKNMGYDFELAPVQNCYTHIFKDEYSQFQVLTFYKDDAVDANDLSNNIIDSIYLQSEYNVPNCLSIGEFTSDTTPEDVYQTLGMPHYFTDKEHLEDDDWKFFEWTYYNDDKGVALQFLFDYRDSENKDIEIEVEKGEENRRYQYETILESIGGYTSGSDIFRELYPSFAGDEPVEQEPFVAIDDKKITIEGNQITFKETTVEEILAMFPEMEYRPYSLSRYKDNDELSSYDFFLENENISMIIYGRDFEAVERARERECNSSNTIKLEGNEPDIDLSKFKVLRIDFGNIALSQEIGSIRTIADIDNLNISEEIENSLILYNGVKIGMTEEEVLEIYPELSCSQESGYFVVYDAEFNQESRMNYRLIFYGSPSPRDELKNMERRLTEVDIVIW